MRRARLATTLAAIPLAAVACGTGTASSGGTPGAPVTTGSGTAATARSYAGALLARVQLPTGAARVAKAPTKVLDRLPESPSLSKTPTVVERFWTVDQQAVTVFDWLRQHRPGMPVSETGSGASTQPCATAPCTVASQFLGYRPVTLPHSIGAAYLYLTVVSTGPSTSAIGAYAVTLAQPARPAAEVVPPSVSRAVVGWSLAVGGTPVRKTLTGAAASKLAKDFNALPVDVAGVTACPMIPSRTSDVTVTFTASGHTWTVDIPACPDIHVTRDGQVLPSLSFGNPFLADVRSYSGYLPQSGPPSAPGGAIPLVQTPTKH